MKTDGVNQISEAPRDGHRSEISNREKSNAPILSMLTKAGNHLGERLFVPKKSCFQTFSPFFRLLVLRQNASRLEIEDTAHQTHRRKSDLSPHLVHCGPVASGRSVSGS